jgi:hypothetical protein
MFVANRASTEVIDVFIDLNKGTVYLSSELFPFFCMYLVLPFSPFLLYTSLFILNSPRFHAYCYLLSFCLSHASPGSHFFPSLLFSGSFVQCAQLFLQFLTFPIPDRSIIIALRGNVQPRIKAPLPFQNILSRPWSVKINLTDGPSCWIHLVKPWICGLSFFLHCRKNGPSE